MKYLPTSDADRAQMLASIGVSSVDRDILPSDDRLPA